MTIRQRSILLALLFAVSLALASVASAQDRVDGDGALLLTESVIDVSDDQIDAFAAALLEVQQIGQEWTQRMQNAEDNEQIAEMREEARDLMVSAIEDQGMTVEEYNEIATAAQDDPALAQRIQQAAAAY